MKIHCPHCSNPIDAGPINAGTDADCPHCGKEFGVPDISTFPVNDQMEYFSHLLDEAAQGPKRPILHCFQHVTLREAVFQNHPELIRDLGRPDTLLPLGHFRSKAQLRLSNSAPLSVDQFCSQQHSGDVDEIEWFTSLAIHPFTHHGFTIYVVTMPEPKHTAEAYFVAIVHRNSEEHTHMKESPSTRYFTLELTIDRSPKFCEWSRDGMHMPYNTIVAPHLNEFAQAVGSLITPRS